MRYRYEDNMAAMLRRKGYGPKYDHAGIYCILLDERIVYIGKSVNSGEWRKEVLRDAGMIARIQDRWDIRDGHYIGTPTVKELIAILSKLPQDYKVTCCGGENYLYRFEEGKYITIDNERCLN